MVTGHGLIRLPQFFERKPKIVVRLDVIGLDGKGLRDEINGRVVFSHLVGNYTKQMQGDRLIGVALQYLLIDILSLRQAACSVMLNGEVQGLLDGWCLLFEGRTC